MSRYLKMGQVVAHSGISRQVLHRYIDLGLIGEATRTDAGHRLFDHSVIEELALIQELNATGYTLRDIREIFFRRRRAG